VLLLQDALPIALTPLPFVLPFILRSFLSRLPNVSDQAPARRARR
jgi:hypothetical protein